MVIPHIIINGFSHSVWYEKACFFCNFCTSSPSPRMSPFLYYCLAPEQIPPIFLSRFALLQRKRLALWENPLRQMDLSIKKKDAFRVLSPNLLGMEIKSFLLSSRGTSQCGGSEWPNLERTTVGEPFGWRALKHLMLRAKQVEVAEQKQNKVGKPGKAKTFYWNNYAGLTFTNNTFVFLLQFWNMDALILKIHLFCLSFFHE